MDEYAIVRSMLLRVAGGVPATAPLARAVLEWAQLNAEWLVPGREDELTWDALLGSVAEARAFSPRPQVLELADGLAELLSLTPLDAALLRLMVAYDRLPRVAALARVAARHGHDLPALLGELAGADRQDADRAVRRSVPVRLDLASFVANRQGEVEVNIRWTLERLLDRAPVGGEAMLDSLVGQRQPATLSLNDFSHVKDADFLVRLLAGALGEGAEGINILVYGPPGTGKSSPARWPQQPAPRFTRSARRTKMARSRTAGNASPRSALRSGCSRAGRARCCCSTRWRT